MRVPILIFVFIAFDWVNCVLAITNGNKSESKLKREDNRRNYNDFQEDTKVFQSSKERDDRTSRYREPLDDLRHKDRVHVKDRDSSLSGSGQYDRGYYGFYAPAEDAVAGYGYQDFDQTPHYGPPVPDRGTGGGFSHHPNYDGGFEYQDHREPAPHYGYIPQHHGPDHHTLALKGILLPLAGVALLGAAAALVTNPVLLQLGVISGRRRRSVLQDIFKADQSQTENINNELIKLKLRNNLILPALTSKPNSNLEPEDYAISSSNDTENVQLIESKLLNDTRPAVLKIKKIINESKANVKIHDADTNTSNTDENIAINSKAMNDNKKGKNSEELEEKFEVVQNRPLSPLELILHRSKKDIGANNKKEYILQTDDYDDVIPDSNVFDTLRKPRRSVL